MQNDNFIELKRKNLSLMNGLRLKSEAEFYIEVSQDKHLKYISNIAHNYPGVFVLGGGNNVIVPEKITKLVVQVKLNGLRLISEQHDHVLVEVGAGAQWHDFVLTCLKNGWYGIENLAFIPGTVGASPVQNIGAYGVEVSDNLVGITAWHTETAQFIELNNKECEFEYRDSIFKKSIQGSWIITSVRFKLSRIWNPILHYQTLLDYLDSIKINLNAIKPNDVIKIISQIRRDKLPDPAVIPNLGCFFKNPIIKSPLFKIFLKKFSNLVFYKHKNQFKLSSGWMIDNIGWRGKQIGQVGIHKKHSLVIYNAGSATSSDIICFVNKINKAIYDFYSIQLEIEPFLLH